MRIRRRSSQRYQSPLTPPTPWHQDEGGRERESAITIAAPGVWRISDANSEMYASWRCWRADQGGETLERAETKGR